MVYTQVGSDSSVPSGEDGQRNQELLENSLQGQRLQAVYFKESGEGKSGVLSSQAQERGN